MARITAIPPTAANVARGIGLTCVAALMFSATHAITKWLGSDYGMPQILFFRSLFAMVVLIPFFARDGLAVLRSSRPGLQGMRCAAGLISIFAFFYALPLMPLAELIALNFTMPLFLTALSVPLLKEPVGWRRWSAVLVGFVGVVIIAQPAGAEIGWPVVLPIASAFFYAIAAIAMRRLGTTDSVATTSFYFALATTIGAGAFLPFIWVTPDWIDGALLVLVGLIGGVAQLALTSAYRYAPAVVVAPFDYTGLIWAAMFGYFIWAEVPGWSMVEGAAILVAAGIFILYRETIVARRRERARAAPPP